jgi:adenosylcobinamide-GDP ribazoletransferase
LTAVPDGFRDGAPTEVEIAASRFAFPLVGLMIGLLLAALSAGLGRWGVGPGLAAFFLLAAGVAITGGLHLDGLADASDGLLLPRGDAERRLVVMRDPHTGSFGVVALVLLLLGKYAALTALTLHGRTYGVLGAAVVGRTLALVSAGMAPYARPEGTGRILVEATTARDATVAAFLVLVTGITVARLVGLTAAATSLGVAWLLSRFADRRLGGVTGDILGAVVEVGELAFLVVLGISS